MNKTFNILLIDDSAADTMLTRKTVERSAPPSSPLNFNCVTTLKNAKQQLAEQSFDCILLDMNLPDGRGISNVETISAAAPNTPIVVVSGSINPLMAEQLIEAGVASYAEKQPLSHKIELFAIINNAINNFEK